MTLVKREIGEILVDNGQITDEELARAKDESKATGEAISVVLSTLGLVDENQMKSALELEYGVNYVDLKEATPQLDALKLIPESLCTALDLVPVSRDDKRLTLAMVTPSDSEALSELTPRLEGLQVKTLVCLEEDFADFVKRAYAEITPREPKPAPKVRIARGDQLKLEPLTPSQATGGANALPVGEPEDMAIVLLSNHILSSAVARGCTNIHIEPTEKQILVHYRKDGVLFSARKLPSVLLKDLVRRFIAMAEEQKLERSLPFDARVEVQLSGEPLAFRLSIIRGAFGEHLVIWLD